MAMTPPAYLGCVFAGTDLRRLARQDAHSSQNWALQVFFFSNEGTEPPHIHVQRDRGLAKFWLQPVALARVTGFRAVELRRVEKLIDNHRERFLEAWHEYFGR